jgi:hypothetical protein
MKKWVIGLLVGGLLLAGAWFLVSSVWRRGPLVQIYAQPPSGSAPLTVTLANMAGNPEDEGLQFEWTVDGAVVSDKGYFLYELQSPGEHTITLKVTDPRGFSDTDTTTVRVNPAPRPPLAWSVAGPLKNMASCVLVNEPADPAPGGDNYLCSVRDFGLQWSPDGPLEGMRCTQVQEPAEPLIHGWDNNYLCVPDSSRLELAWSAEGRIEEKRCLPVGEPGDSHAGSQGWRNTYLCYSFKKDGAQKQADSPPQ